MNHLAQLERIITAAQRPGYFRRDQNGDEHEVFAYVVQFSYEHHGERKNETAVVVAPSVMAAQAAATKPYKDAWVVSAQHYNLGSNPTVLRIPHLLED